MSKGKYTDEQREEAIDICAIAASAELNGITGQPTYMSIRAEIDASEEAMALALDAWCYVCPAGESWTREKDMEAARILEEGWES